MHLNETEFAILSALAGKVRVLSRDQIVRAWTSKPSDFDHIMHSLARLIANKLVTMHVWTVVVPNTNREPIFTWKPKAPDPDSWQISLNAKQRWNQKSNRVFVYQATAAAGRIFGARTGGLIREIEQQHDLLLGEVYIDYVRYLPELAEHWIGEDLMPIAAKGVKNPDAFLLDQDLQPRRVIESAGAYSQRQIRTFHQYCVRRSLPYELW